MLQLIEKYLNHLQNFERKSQKTISAYRIDLLQFANFLNDHEMELISLKKGDLMSFLQFLYEKTKAKQRSVARKVSCIKSFAKFLVKSSNFTESQLSSIFLLKQPKFTKKLPHVIDNNKILQVIQYIKSEECKIYKNNWEKSRDVALIVLLYTSGMRISEVLSVTKSDVIENTSIKIIGKGRKERVVPISSVAKKFVNIYLSEVPIKSNILFIGADGKQYSARSFQKKLENIRKNLNIPDFFTPHCLRHSCATELLSNNANIRQIQELLGHSSLSTTQVYTHIDASYIKSRYDEIMNK